MLVFVDRFEGTGRDNRRRRRGKKASWYCFSFDIETEADNSNLLFLLFFVVSFEVLNLRYNVSFQIHFSSSSSSNKGTVDLSFIHLSDVSLAKQFTALHSLHLVISFIEKRRGKNEGKPIILLAGGTDETCVERKALSILQRPSCYGTVEAGIDVDSFPGTAPLVISQH